MSEIKVDVIAATTGDLVQRMSLSTGAVVKDVKAMLYARLGIYPELQQLLFQDQILDDVSKLISHQPLSLDATGAGVTLGVGGRVQPGPRVATRANGLASALGENGLMESVEDVHSYQLQLEVIMPESGEVAELIFTEICNGLGQEMAYSCPVVVGSHLTLALPEGPEGPTSACDAAPLSSERTWVQVVWPAGPKRRSGYVHGKGLPPYGFMSLACLKPLPREQWHTELVRAPRMQRLYS